MKKQAKEYEIKERTKKYAMKEYAMEEYAIKEHTAKEYAIKERVAKEHTTKEYARKEHTIKEHAVKEHTTKEHAAKEHTTKEYAAKEHATKEYVAKEHTIKEHAVKEHATKEYAAKEHATKEYAATEYTTTEHTTKEPPIKRYARYVQYPRKYLNLPGAVLIISLLCLAVKLDAHAVVTDESSDTYYMLKSELPEGETESSYITLFREIEYEVKAGDTLWDISREFLGKGARYQEILEANNDILADAAHILPGETLVIPQYSYLHGIGTRSFIIEDKGAFIIATPGMIVNTFTLQSYLNLGNRPPSGIMIYKMPVTNRMKENELTENWEDFVQEVERCSEEICGGRVTNLAFEKYEVKGGCDLCGYTFDFDTGDGILELAVFYRLGAKNMAEVIGVRDKEQDSKLLDYTRFSAASFEDYGGQISLGNTKTTDYNGADEWDYPELHNVFSAAMSAYVATAERPNGNMAGDYEIEWKEPVLEQALRDSLIALWRLDDTEKEEFLNRPLRASDLAVITRISMTKYRNNQSDAEDTEMLRLGFNGHLEEIPMEKGTDFSYDDFSHFTGAEALGIAVYDTTDFSFIADMVHLKELSIAGAEGMSFENVDFLAGLKELKYLSLGGNEDGFSKITELSVLEDSKNLKYLYLTMPRLADFSFLKECTEICTIELEGMIEGVEPVTPDLGLLSNARFIKFYGKNLRWEY